jgi:hypothetical protein
MVFDDFLCDRRLAADLDRRAEPLVRRGLEGQIGGAVVLAPAMSGW